MVFLNENISFNVNLLRQDLCTQLCYFVNNILEPNVGNDKIEYIENCMIKEIKNMFDSNFFIYKNMNPNLCTNMFKKAKREGYFCCKKIKTNLCHGKKISFVVHIVRNIHVK